MLTELGDELYSCIETLEEKAMLAAGTESLSDRALRYSRDVRDAMKNLRKIADRAETMVARDYWPFPSYTDILFY